MSDDDVIKSKVLDLSGVSLTEIIGNPEYAAAAKQLADQLLSDLDEGVIDCGHSVEVTEQD